MNKLIQLIPVSKYDRIPIKAIETLLTVHTSKQISEVDDQPELSPLERLSFEIYPRRKSNFELCAKRVEAQQFALKPTLLNFLECTEHELDHALNNQDPMIIYNVVPSKFAQYLEASGIGKLVARWWQILPPEIPGCDLAIADLDCLQERGIKFYFLVPQFLPPKCVDWQRIFRAIRSDHIKFINSTGGNIKVFPLIDPDLLQYNRADGLRVESIASTFCRTSPELRESLAKIMSIFLEVRCGEKLETSTGAKSIFRLADDSRQIYPSEQIKLTQTLVGSREVHTSYQVFKFVGILDAFSEPAFRTVMGQYIEVEINVVLDLLDLDFVDSSGLGALVLVVKQVQAVEGTVQIIVNTSVARTINLVGLQQFLCLQSSVKAAIALLS
jgi:anti-anti-sigma factor